MSIFAIFRSFAFFRNPLFYRERTRNTRNTRKPYVTFRNLSRFRFFSQSFILPRKDAEYAEYAETIYHFSKSFALSLFFAIIYFIAKGRGKRGIRGNHISLFEVFRAFAFFRNHIFYRERTRKTRNTRKPRYIFWGNNRASFEHLRFLLKWRLGFFPRS